MKSAVIGLLVLLALTISCKRGGGADAAKRTGAEASRARLADGWVEFSSAEGNFAANFPQSPSNKLLESENGATTSAVTANVNDAVSYEVLYATFAEQPVNPEDVTKAKEGFLRGLGKCSIEYDRPASLPLEDFLGRSYRARCMTDDGTALTTDFNVYIGRPHYFTSSVIWRTDDPEPHDGDKFLNSIRLLQRGK